MGKGSFTYVLENPAAYATSEPASSAHDEPVPDLTGPEGYDLLQVSWCPLEAHGPDESVDVVLKRRRDRDVGAVLAERPEPLVVGSPGADTCVSTPVPRTPSLRIGSASSSGAGAYGPAETRMRAPFGRPRLRPRVRRGAVSAVRGSETHGA